MIRQTKENIQRWRNYYEGLAGYPLSDNQVEFCLDADDANLDIEYDYSGRYMYGKTCPAVYDDVPTMASVAKDSMGRGIVTYARS
jgi:hypothetical protein